MVGLKSFFYPKEFATRVEMEVDHRTYSGHISTIHLNTVLTSLIAG
jgi:hypothetical protein